MPRSEKIVKDSLLQDCQRSSRSFEICKGDVTGERKISNWPNMSLRSLAAILPDGCSFLNFFKYIFSSSSVKFVWLARNAILSTFLTLEATCWFDSVRMSSVPTIIYSKRTVIKSFLGAKILIFTVCKFLFVLACQATSGTAVCSSHLAKKIHQNPSMI